MYSWNSERITWSALWQQQIMSTHVPWSWSLLRSAASFCIHGRYSWTFRYLYVTIRSMFWLITRMRSTGSILISFQIHGKWHYHTVCTATLVQASPVGPRKEGVACLCRMQCSSPGVVVWILWPPSRIGGNLKDQAVFMAVSCARNVCVWRIWMLVCALVIQSKHCQLASLDAGTVGRTEQISRARCTSASKSEIASLSNVQKTCVKE